MKVMKMKREETGKSRGGGRSKSCQSYIKFASQRTSTAKVARDHHHHNPHPIVQSSCIARRGNPIRPMTKPGSGDEQQAAAQQAASRGAGDSTQPRK
jgi:hypothetical protein